MADSWWDELLERLFTPGILGQVQTAPGATSYKGFGAAQSRGLNAQMAEAGKSVQAELDREEQQANGTPTPQATTPAQQQMANPNAREGELVGQNIGNAVNGVQITNPLYGAMPNSRAFLGYGPRYERGKGSEKYVRDDITDTLQAVIEGLNDWTEKKRRKFAELAVDAGLLKEVTTNYDKLEPILASLAIRSAKLYQRGIKVTPWGLLERYGKAGSKDGTAGGPITTTTVNRSINLTSPREADALVDAALQQRLGRSPTEKEKKAFLAALNSAEKKEPSVTKTTTTTTGSGTQNVSSTSNTQTSGGVDVGAFAKEWSLSHNRDEAGSFQALAQYMPDFFAALGAPV